MNSDKSFPIFLLFLALVYGKRGQNPCEGGNAPCDNGECISRWGWCDLRTQCTDRSDEKYCRRRIWASEEVPDNNCLEKHLVCDDGMCIPASLRCDGDRDCFDGSDEENCETFEQDEFRYTSEKEFEYFSTTSTPAKKREIGTTTLPTSTASTTAQLREIYTTPFPISTDIYRSWRTTSTPAQRREISTKSIPRFTDFFNSLRTTNTPARRRESSTTALTTSTNFHDCSKTSSTPAQRRDISTTALPTSTDFYDSWRTTSTTAQRKEMLTTALPTSTGYYDNWRTGETHNNVMHYYYLLPLSNTDNPYAPPPIINPNYNPFDSRYPEQNKNSRGYDIFPGENFPNNWQPRVPETTIHGRPYIPSPITTRRQNPLRPGYPYVGRGRPEVFPPRSLLYTPRTALTISLRHNVRRPEYSHFYFANSYIPDFESKYRTDIRNAKDWLLSQRDVSYGWDRDTPRGLNAFLPFSNSFQFDVEDDELMRKSLRTHFGVKIGINELVPNDGDELILLYESEF